MAGRYARVSFSSPGGLPRLPRCVASATTTHLTTHVSIQTDTCNQPQINNQDQDHDQDDHDDLETPTQQSSNPLIRQSERAHSPPPSFHSRASSLERRRQGVDPTLADAFDNDDDDSDDDEPDDRQRLVRGNSFPVDAGTSNAPSQRHPMAPALPPRQPTQWPTTTTTPSAASNAATHVPGRTYGAGIQSDGVFSNMMARPERGEKIVEEQPPVCIESSRAKVISGSTDKANNYD